jgi:hypothetical protein
MAAALLGLIMALGLLGALPRLYTVKRHLNALLPFISIAAAWALLHTEGAPGLARRAAAGGAVGLLLALSLAMLLAAPQPAWPQLVETLDRRLEDGDAIWVDELDAPVFAYYWQERSPWQPLRVHDLDALSRAPDGQRVWLVGGVSTYRDLRQTLPPAFAASRLVGDAAVWRDAALTAYDGSVQPQPVATPSPALVWGLAFQSPLEVDCSP